MSVSSSPFFGSLCHRVHLCECCGCIHESEALFSITPGVTFNCSADVDGCLAVFPRHKGRTSVTLFFLFVSLVAVKSLWSTIIP
jgi:hypothetical protein